MTGLLLLLAIAVILAALYFSRQANIGKLPGEVVYDDTIERVEKALVSHRYRLAGKPDHIIRTRDGFMPVEKKSRDWRGREALPGDRAQVLAYCLLVEESRGRPVSRGLLKYANSEFIIPFGDRQREEIVALLSEMHYARNAQYVARSHANAKKCLGCGVRSACGEAVG